MDGVSKSCASYLRQLPLMALLLSIGIDDDGWDDVVCESGVNTATRLRIRTPHTKIPCSYINPYMNRLLSYAHTFLALFSQYKTKAPPLPRLADLDSLILSGSLQPLSTKYRPCLALGHLLFLKDSSILAIYPIVSSNWIPYPYLTSHLCEVTSSAPPSHQTNLQKVSGWLASCQARLCGTTHKRGDSVTWHNKYIVVFRYKASLHYLFIFYTLNLPLLFILLLLVP